MIQMNSILTKEDLEKQYINLKRKNRKLEERNEYYRRKVDKEKDSYQNAIRPQIAAKQKIAKAIIEQSEDGIAAILSQMEYGSLIKGGCSFCEIFDLSNFNSSCNSKEKVNSRVETDCNCINCIHDFLINYYREVFENGKNK